MPPVLRSRITGVWLLLVGATVLSWVLGHGLGLQDARLASAAIIAVAFLKARYVILDFMEIRHAPLGMRIAGELWPALACTAVLVVYLVAP